MQKGRGRKFKKREKPEFDQQIVDLARVTRVTKGGKQLSFRVCIVIGDRKNRVGYGVAKGKDVQIAVEKAVRQAKKNLMTIPYVNESIPHRVESKFKAAKIMIKPAPKGSGIIAGGAVRTVLELAGVPNISAKMIGKTTNKLTNVRAVMLALTQFHRDALAKAKSSTTPVVKKSEKVIVNSEKNSNAKTKKKKEVSKKEEKSAAITKEKK
ncbi:MAG: 30S ribosomal protein S5 [Candidatus Magasanikbacteria bacterium]|nr:30S ribosomal protein S5 [Candidatus Magasanikbacteria bacterium]|tara:strand:+ start:3845 stop:4474 length:630 start_codon:yes stop_codon:yes gene_type:complete